MWGVLGRNFQSDLWKEQISRSPSWIREDTELTAPAAVWLGRKFIHDRALSFSLVWDPEWRVWCGEVTSGSAQTVSHQQRVELIHFPSSAFAEALTPTPFIALVIGSHSPVVPLWPQGRSKNVSVSPGLPHPRSQCWSEKFLLVCSSFLRCACPKQFYF